MPKLDDSYPEDKTRNPDRWSDFRGWQAETAASKQPPDYLPLIKQLQSPSPRDLQSFKKGGKVKKMGVYKLHKGERVVPAKTVKKVEAQTSKRQASDMALLKRTPFRR